MHRALFLVGPTASGKSKLAVQLAESCDAEIVNVDAFQMYDGLRILTAQPDPSLLRRVPHHLVGVLPLSAQNHVARFLGLAREALIAISQRGRLAVLVGGTGLYIRALIHGLSPLPPARPDIRAELETVPLADLTQRLKNLDAKTAQSIDLQNRRRVVRALEICLATGEKYSELIKGNPSASVDLPLQFSPLIEGLPQGYVLDRGRDDLRQRIDRRVDEMFASGVVEEVEALRDGDIGPTASQALGLRQIQALVRGELTEHECRSRVKVATWQYAKRQITWFRKSPDFQRLPISLSEPVGSLAALVSLRGVAASGTHRHLAGPAC